VAAGVLLAFLFLVPSSLLLVSAGLPDPAQLNAAGLPQATRIYDRSGTILLAEIHKGGERRRVVPLREISPLLVQATVAVEDHSFYQHHGLNFGRILKAGWQDITRGHIEQGGSTITQQLVKNLLLSRSGAAEQRSFFLKLREAILAVQVEQRYSKDQILEAYLNRVYYGAQSYGAEAAALTYFGPTKHARDLDLAQASLLAGLPKSPSQFDPYVNRPAALQRQKTVLDAMVRAGRVTRGQADEALRQSAAMKLEPLNTRDEVKAPHFVRWVAAQLENSYRSDLLQGGGLVVTTTLDWRLQEAGQRIVAEKVRELGGLNVSNGALVALQPQSGEVLAMVGSAGLDVPGGEYNMTLTPRQPGSAFKIFTYAAAIESRSFTAASLIQDSPLTLPRGGDPNGMGPYTVRNYDGRYHGWVTLPQALGNSFNIPAVKVEITPGVGVPRVVETARRMGVAALNQPTDSYSPSLTLGAYEVPLLQMANGAATLAAQGTWHRPQGVLRVADARGKTLSTLNTEARAGVSPQVAFILSDILADNRNRTMAFGAQSDLVIPGYHVAAKTGTTNNNKDNLTIGYTPNVAAAVWVGNANSAPMSPQATGITGAAPIWHDFMLVALKGVPDQWYAAPSGLVTRQVRGALLYFLPGTENVRIETPPENPGSEGPGQGNDGDDDD
jgi:membrane peptidoglycan carboxypeptidase